MTESDPNPPSEPLPHAAVSLDDVRHVAALASLHLTGDEELRMRHDLNAVLGYVAMLRALDTTGVPPLSQISELFEAAPELAGASLRPDESRPSVDRALVLHDAPETDGRFFVVPKVIER